MKILIIEDEYSLADAISEALQKEKFMINIITNEEIISFEAKEDFRTFYLYKDGEKTDYTAEV